MMTHVVALHAAKWAGRLPKMKKRPAGAGEALIERLGIISNDCARLNL